MIDIFQIADENIREVSAPLTMDQLREKFENESLAFVIDYEASKFRGMQFITYVGNLKLECDLKISDNVTKEERFELIEAFMNSKIIAPIQSLVDTVANIMLHAKYIDGYQQVLFNPILTSDEVMEFIDKNKNMIDKWRVVLDSMIIYLMSINKKYVEAFGHPKDVNHIVDDANAIGNNFVHLFKRPFFVELFYSIPGNEYHYFIKQFEDYMFDAKNLFEFFFIEENPLPAIFNFLPEISEDDLNQMHEEVKILDEYLLGAMGE